MKVKTSIEDQIKILLSRNVKFNIIDVEHAKKFLADKTYYFKLAAYRENFDYNKLHNGEIQYKDLEFAYLVELSKIDMYLRYVVLELSLDIEHFLKRWIINDCTNDQSDDGFQLVNMFFENNNTAKTKITGHLKSSYSHDLIQKYINNMPIWVFAEVSTFGDFLYFYQYYCKSKNITYPIDNKILNQIKSLRNACAHNNCIINNIDKRLPATTNLNARVKLWASNLLKNAAKINVTSMLRHQVIYDFVSILYAYCRFADHKVVGKKIFRLYLLFNKRIKKNKRYFKKNQRLMNAYKFVYEIINQLRIKYCKFGLKEMIKYVCYI